MNPNPTGNRDVAELWGREFNIVKNGLSEAQVVSFVNDLAKQHDILIQRQEHLTSLTKLAERTLSEADKLADEIKREAESQAKDKIAKMMSEAENQVKEKTIRMLAEAKTAAESKSSQIIADAETSAQELVKEREAQAMAAAAKQAEEIKLEAEKRANGIKTGAETEAKRIITEAESRGRYLAEQIEAEASTAATEQARMIVESARQEASTLLEREKQRIQPEVTQFVGRLRAQLLSELEDIKHKVGTFDTQFEQMLPETSSGSNPSEGRQEVKPDDFMELVQDTNEAERGEPDWEIEIVPPIDIMKIMNIVSYLDGLPEVVRTEIIPRNDRTSVTVHTGQSLELLPMIKNLPEVANAQEENRPDNAKGSETRRITLSLSVKTSNAESLA